MATHYFEYISSFVLAGRVAPYIQKAFRGVDVKVCDANVSLMTDSALIHATCHFTPELIPYFENMFPEQPDCIIENMVIHLAPHSVAEVLVDIRLYGQVAANLRNAILTIFE